MKIYRIRLCHAQPMGREAAVDHHVSTDSVIDKVHPVLTFDQDPRFIRLAFPGKDYFELIPLSNVASIHVVDEPKSAK